MDGVWSAGIRVVRSYSWAGEREYVGVENSLVLELGGIAGGQRWVE